MVHLWWTLEEQAFKPAVMVVFEWMSVLRKKTRVGRGTRTFFEVINKTKTKNKSKNKTKQNQQNNNNDVKGHHFHPRTLPHTIFVYLFVCLFVFKKRVSNFIMPVLRLGSVHKYFGGAWNKKRVLIFFFLVHKGGNENCKSPKGGFKSIFRVFGGEIKKICSTPFHWPIKDSLPLAMLTLKLVKSSKLPGTLPLDPLLKTMEIWNCSFFFNVICPQHFLIIIWTCL